MAFAKDDHSQVEHGLMQVATAFAADEQAGELVQVREVVLYDMAVFSKSGAVVGVASRDARQDVAHA